MSELESGYYWIKIRSNEPYIVAEWNSNTEKWLLTGVETSFHKNTPSVILTERLIVDDPDKEWDLDEGPLYDE